MKSDNMILDNVPRINGVRVCPTCSHPVFDMTYLETRRDGTTGCKDCVGITGCALRSKRKKNIKMFFGGLECQEKDR